MTDEFLWRLTYSEPTPEEWAQRIQHVDDPGVRYALCGASWDTQGEWFAPVGGGHHPTCPGCVAVLVARRAFGEIPWWNWVRRLQLRAEELGIHRKSRAARTVH